MKRFRRNKKGVSPVIATIIIVAVAIVMSIAVAYWVLGLGASMTRYEKVQFISAYAPDDQSIEFLIKNTGSATATIDTSAVFINGKTSGATNPNTIVWDTTNSTATGKMDPGDTLLGTINFDALPSGTSVEAMLQTTAGNQYPKVVVLP